MKNNHLARQIYNLRQTMKLNQADFAAKLGVTAMSVSRWEAGTNDPPAECMVKMGVLSKDAKVFWYFLGEIGLTKRDMVGRL